MKATILSDKGHVKIPHSIRAAHRWKKGQRFTAVDTGDGILLKPTKKVFPETSLKEVVSCLHYEGPAKTLEDMEEAVRQGAKESCRDRS
jgi:bifunctional DNA-binding transcriptional regulator/antitoxin component of YhaV-PrlF toxin-antitoxin module